ncbi:hypothetical protein CROQUDRAFT_108574 [Cronartium quercuum f. sp. fusiforme G11]|uniref:Uncharacterized protein n=1 Tax=Cronartium quercuum f. sp. fusiforme G11 TaxID=708437 RepID=A0A9P6T9Q4_9BASI|nr:hypothetical protein CROQUDRAFT_108574 [Cronartium quercuum f. sp. fusiforme G11]
MNKKLVDIITKTFTNYTDSILSKSSSVGQNSDSEDPDSNLILCPYVILNQDQSLNKLDPIDKDPDFVYDDESSELDSDSDDLSLTETSPPAMLSKRSDV